MQSAVLAGPERVELTEVDAPAAGAGEVRVRLQGCGVCASSIPLFEGREWFDYPRPAGEPGHEGWGVVEALGPGVADLQVGTRVGLISYRAFAELDVAAADAVVPLPGELAGQPVPLEPLACAMNAFRRSDVRPGQTVAVVGIGFLGALLVQLARAAGARVLALSRRDTSLAVAERCGADAALPLADPWEAIRRVRQETGDRGCERVIECVGLQEALDVATELTAVRGRLVIAGYHQDGKRQVDLQQWNWRGLDVVNAHERDPAEYVRGAREAVAALCDGRLDTAELLTHAYPLRDLGAALDAARQRPAGFFKAWVQP